MSISAGWQNGAGTVSANGLNMTENFDIAFYVNGDIKPATFYDTELIVSYEDIMINGKGGAIPGGVGSDYLVGQGDKIFVGDEYANRIFGLDGSDPLLGLEDNALLYGCTGDDSLLGGDGNDLLVGGEDAEKWFAHSKLRVSQETLVNSFIR